MSKYAGKLITLGASSGNSAQFPGATNAYLETPWNAAFTLGASDFTIEAWIYPTTNASLAAIFSNYTATQGQFIIRRTAANRLETVFSIGAPNTTTAASTFILPNQWTHIAIVRNTSLTMYVNGVADTSVLLIGTSVITNTGQVLRVGTESATVNPFFGFISNLRMVIGTALYTSNFSPPMNLTPITNTVYLTCNTDVLRDASTNGFSVTATGTGNIRPQVSTFTPFAGITPNNANPALGTTQGGVFTPLEMANYAVSKQISLYDPLFSSTIMKVSGIGVNLQDNNDFVADTASTQTATSTSSSLLQTTLSVGGTITGAFAVGMEVTGTGVLPGTIIVGYNTGTGGAGSYIINKYYSSSVLSIPITATGGYYVARTGTVTQGAFNPYIAKGNFGVLFNGSSGFTTPAGLNTALGGGFAGKDYTMEAWVYPTTMNTANGGRTVILGGYSASPTNGRWVFGWFASAAGARAMFGYTSGTSSDNFIGPNTNVNTIPLNQWTHLAVTINSAVATATVIKLFTNGRLVFTSGAIDFNAAFQTAFAQNPTVGNGFGGVNNAFVGYMSNLRITYQTLLYTDDFVPPISPLLNTGTGTPNTAFLVCQSSGFRDSSNNNFALGISGTPQISPKTPFVQLPYEQQREGASAFFDGTASYLTLPSPSSLVVPFLNEFRISFWVYFNADTTTTQYIYDARDTAGQVAPTIYVTAGTLRFATAGVDRITSGTLTARQWYYVLISRIGSGTTYVTTMFINGVAVGSPYTDDSAFVVGTNRPVIGSLGTTLGTSPLNGYLSDLRVIVSTDNRATDATVPTSPLRVIPFTAVLMNFANAGIYDATRTANLTTVSTTLRNVQSRFGGTGNLTGSMLVASGATITINTPFGATAVSNPLPVLGDITVECWALVTSFGASNPTIIFLNGNSTDFAALRVQLDSTGSITLLVSTTGAAWAINSATATGLITLNRWNHIAVTRFGTNFTLFLNGVQVLTSTAVTATTALLTANFSRIGGVPTTANVANFYMQDFRITRGARYTTQFTPPVALLPIM
jgi:hypothetical protein